MAAPSCLRLRFPSTWTYLTYLRIFWINFSKYILSDLHTRRWIVLSFWEVVLPKWTNTTVRLPPPWRILAITWPKIMLRKNWSNQNGHQDPAPNMGKRRGAAQRFDCLRVSLPDMSCFLLITSSSTWVLMVIWLKNYPTIHHISVAHGEWAWEWLVRWQSSMDWSSYTQNMPNQNGQGGS